VRIPLCANHDVSRSCAPLHDTTIAASGATSCEEPAQESKKHSNRTSHTESIGRLPPCVSQIIQRIRHWVPPLSKGLITRVQKKRNNGLQDSPSFCSANRQGCSAGGPGSVASCGFKIGIWVAKTNTSSRLSLPFFSPVEKLGQDNSLTLRVHSCRKSFVSAVDLVSMSNRKEFTDSTAVQAALTSRLTASTKLPQ